MRCQLFWLQRHNCSRAAPPRECSLPHAAGRHGRGSDFLPPPILPLGGAEGLLARRQVPVLVSVDSTVGWVSRALFSASAPARCRCVSRVHSFASADAAGACCGDDCASRARLLGSFELGGDRPDASGCGHPCTIFALDSCRAGSSATAATHEQAPCPAVCHLRWSDRPIHCGARLHLGPFARASPRAPAGRADDSASAWGGAHASRCAERADRPSEPRGRGRMAGRDTCRVAAQAWRASRRRALSCREDGRLVCDYWWAGWAWAEGRRDAAASVCASKAVANVSERSRDARRSRPGRAAAVARRGS